jgi:hypothetical protein
MYACVPAMVLHGTLVWLGSNAEDVDYTETTDRRLSTLRGRRSQFTDSVRTGYHNQMGKPYE